MNEWTRAWQEMVEESLRLQRDSAEAFQEMLGAMLAPGDMTAVARASTRMWQNGIECASMHAQGASKLAAAWGSASSGSDASSASTAETDRSEQGSHPEVARPVWSNEASSTSPSED